MKISSIIRASFATVALVAMSLSLMAIPVAAQSTPAADQPVVVEDTELTWTGAWEYDEASSMDAQATLAQIDQSAGSLQLASYGVFADESVEDPEAAVQAFSDAFFESAGAEAIQESATGELENGGTWKVYSFDLQGLPLSVVLTASQMDNSDFVVSTLTANTGTFADSITAAQEEIMLDGEPTFLEGVDADEATANLGGQASPVASPEATPAS
jgi:hypothetical protein